MNNSFDAIKTWFSSSGLVKTDDSEERGGVHSYYDEQKKQYGFLYPEITGYAVSTFAFLHNIDKNSKFLTMAKMSADWLIKLYEKYGGIIQSVSNGDSGQRLVYSFDSAVCAKGFLDYYAITNEQKYLDYGKKLVSWLLSEALDKDGTIKPYKNLVTNNFEENTDLWYKQKGCLHIKAAIPIFQLSQIDSGVSEKAIQICDTITLFQKTNGSISIHQNSNVIHIHTLCYALEGLLYAYHFTNNSNYLQSCVSALDWCASKIEKDGSVALWHNSQYPSTKTSYHIAQLIRLMILVDKIQDGNRYSKYIEKLFAFLLTLQATSSDNKVNGGFYEEFHKTIFGWKKRQKLNSWGSMFALQAIYLKEHRNQVQFNDFIKFLF